MENGIEQKWENAIEKLTARKIRLHIFDLSLVSHFDQNQIDIRFSLLFSYSVQIASYSCLLRTMPSVRTPWQNELNASVCAQLL